MSLESILNHIINEAKTERDNIILQANQQKQDILLKANQQADRLYQEILDKEKSIFESQRQKLIVNARLESKKQLLSAKQELIDTLFEKIKSEMKRDKFKKKQILQDKTQDIPEDLDFYLNKIRPDYEAQIAGILFDEK